MPLGEGLEKFVELSIGISSDRVHYVNTHGGVVCVWVSQFVRIVIAQVFKHAWSPYVMCE